jgi:hypothetical protein
MEDTREVSISLPSRLLGVVIHWHFFVNCTTTKMCLESTILGPTGDAHLTFENHLLNVEVVSSYVARSKTNVVICELEDACIEGCESLGFPLSQAQLTIQHLSQSKQIG